MFWVSLSHNSAANDRQSTGIDRLRHHLASLLIDSGCDVKTVQARMRHSSAKTTLDVYGHMWPDKDETTRAAIGGTESPSPVEDLVDARDRQAGCVGELLSRGCRIRTPRGSAGAARRPPSRNVSRRWLTPQVRQRPGDHKGDEVAEVSETRRRSLWPKPVCLLLGKAKPDTATTLVSGLGTDYGC
jgi:hypothetical protein